MEHIDTMIKDNLELNNIFNHLIKITDKEKCYNPDCALLILKNNNYFNSLSPEIREIILNYLSHLKALQFPIFDFLNPNNIGLKDNEIKFFDIT